MHVAAIGAACAAGIGIAGISAAFRGTVSIFAHEPAFPCRTDGMPMLLAACEPLDIRMPWEDRLAWLTETALAPVLTAITAFSAPGMPRPRLSVMFSLPTPRPALPVGATLKLASRIATALPIAVDRPASMIVRSGQEGALCCLASAAAYLGAEEPAAVLLGGIDSWMAIEVLHWLESQGRLKRGDVANGIVPGEGAGFLLLVNDALAALAGLAGTVTIRAQSRGYEPNPWYEGRTCRAEGLTRAIRQAFASASDDRRTGLTLGDLNGEPWRAEEWSFAYLRTQRFHSEPLNLWHPADLWGDAGAATGALLLALAAHELLRDPARGRALVWAASDVTPYRSAAIIARDQRSVA